MGENLYLVLHNGKWTFIKAGKDKVTQVFNMQNEA